MNTTAARLLARLYPPGWRQRYAAEFIALLEAERGGVRAATDIVASAFLERIHAMQGGSMQLQRNSFAAAIRRPSAFLPMAMSIAALIVLGVSAVYDLAHGGHGLVRQADEGATAHLWQLLMAGQLPLLLFFAIRWLPRAPRPALYVLALQACAALAAMAPVYFLNL